MTRAESSVIFQARTGKIGLRSYLHSISAEDSRNCPCGADTQSVEHILLCCREFKELRETMWEIQREIDLKALLGSAELAKRPAQFLINTRALPQFSHANLSSTEEDVSDVDTREQRPKTFGHRDKGPQLGLRVLKNIGGDYPAFPPEASRLDIDLPPPELGADQSWQVLGKLGGDLQVRSRPA